MPVMEDKMNTMIINKNRFKILLVMWGLVLLTASPGIAGDRCKNEGQEQMSPIPHHKEPYILNVSPQTNLEDESVAAFTQVVQVPGVPWIQLHFSDYNFGEQSHIIITSLKDGSRQRHDAKSMKQWRNSSAYFNGEAVEIELHVAPGETGIFFSIKEVTVGEWASQSQSVTSEQSYFTIEAQCGNTDDRYASVDKAVGRIVPIGCTGWIVSNGAHLTAGHCVDPDMQQIHFNVPQSLPNGTIVNPPADDQYPIEAIANIDWFNDGIGFIGNDWAVFEVFRNNRTNLLPVEAQGGFFRMTRDLSPLIVRISGFGIDYVPAGTSTNPNCLWNGVQWTQRCNSDSQTQQSDLGSYLGETVQGASDIIIEYIVDTEPANSGSPVFNVGLDGLAIGIHTNGGCNPPNDGNQGTGFEHDNLENAIQNFPGTNVNYVDKGHSIVFEDGSVFRPYDTVLEGINASSGSNAIMSVVKGSYNEQITINKAITLVAPVGTVTIGE
jgi:hypothetical protein